jgi:mercuric ion transport protein
MVESLRAVLRREMTGRNKAGAILAVLTCPCHAVMLIFLLTGTAVGSWLVAVRAYLYAGFTLLFLFGLWLMVRRVTEPCATDACRVPTTADEPAQEEHQPI